MVLILYFSLCFTFFRYWLIKKTFKKTFINVFWKYQPKIYYFNCILICIIYIIICLFIFTLIIPLLTLLHLCIEAITIIIIIIIVIYITTSTMHDCFTPSMKVTYPEYAIMFKYSTEEIMRNEENSTAIVKIFFF